MTNDKLRPDFHLQTDRALDTLLVGETADVHVKYPGEYIATVERVEGGYSVVYRGLIIMVYTVDEVAQITSDLIEKERYRRSKIVAAQERDQYLNISSGVVTFNLTTPSENYGSFRRNTFLGMEMMTAALSHLLRTGDWVVETPWGTLVEGEDQLFAIDWGQF